MGYPCRIGSHEPADIQKIEKEFHFEDAPHEIFVAVGDEEAFCHSMGNGNEYSPAKLIILGYHDVTNGRQSAERSRMDWFLTEEERVSESYKAYFEKLTVYKVMGYPAKELTEPPYDNPLDLKAEAFNNPFRLGGIYVAEILEKGAEDGFTRGLIDTFLTPKQLHSDTLGELTYQSRREMFECECEWLGKRVTLSFYAGSGGKECIDKLRQLEQIWADLEKWDRALREFAAKDMTAGANEWLADKDPEDGVKEPPITEESFMRRITLSSIHLNDGAGFTAYFDDDDMFSGHTIAVEADLKAGCSSTEIMG
ncbi:MAG: DUF2262 domain-containing protein [Ruminococcus sp.]|nr:DUF2262 domain-containing protein [Ruminococcus sp.]